MLIEFKVANYRSIREEQSLSMIASADKELPQNLISCDHVPGMKGIKLVKAVALYGANASGKSNIVAALRFFAEFVRDSATKLQPGAPTGAQPFKLDPACLTQSSKFEITSVINGIRTLYGLELTRERVTSEYLVAYPKGRPQVWFERDWEEKKRKYTWSKSASHFKHDNALREMTRENSALVSVAAQFNQSEAHHLWEWLADRTRLLDLGVGIPNLKFSTALLADKESGELLVKALRRADLGIIAARLKPSSKSFLDKLRERIVEPAPRQSKREARLTAQLLSSVSLPEGAEPELLHKSNGGDEVPFDFNKEESTGTRRMFSLLGEWIWFRRERRFLALDEIETSLHPWLVRELLVTALETKQEKDVSQLLFTTHNPLLLDQTLLRRDQIWFTEKDQEGATRLYPLTDFKPRKDESLVKGYLAGRYGGIPFIPEGLKF